MEKRIIAGAILVAAIGASGTGGARGAPAPQAPAEAAPSAEARGDLPRDRLIASGQGYFPVLVRLADGALGCAIRGGAPHLGRGGRVDFVRSEDEGESWSKPVTAVDTGLDDRNPAVGIARDGTVILACFRYDKYDREGRHDASSTNPSDVLVVRSADHGRTWPAPRRFPMGPFIWLSPYGRMVTLPDGSLLMAIYGNARPLAPGDPVREEPRRNASYIVRSRDNGLTWGDFTRVALDYNETGLLYLGEGRLLAALRSHTGGQYVAIARSDDLGRHFTPPRKITRPAEHPADLVDLGGGRILLVVGERNRPFGARAIPSFDGGITWDRSREIAVCDHATSTDCGYPSAVLRRDGLVLCAYYAVGSTRHREWGTFAGAAIFRPPVPPEGAKAGTAR